MKNTFQREIIILLKTPNIDLSLVNGVFFDSTNMDMRIIDTDRRIIYRRDSSFNQIGTHACYILYLNEFFIVIMIFCTWIYCVW